MDFIFSDSVKKKEKDSTVMQMVAGGCPMRVSRTWEGAEDLLQLFVQYLGD